MSGFPLFNAPRRALLAGGALVIAAASIAVAASASSSPRVALTAAAAAPVAAPPVMPPPPVAVTVDPATTAYLVLDLTSAICAPNPACVSTVPAAAALLAKARAAGAKVIYTQTPNPGSTILPQVAPQTGEPVVIAFADKFKGSDLASILSADGVKTVVIVGTVANGAVLYTSLEANLRGYTVVVAEDGVSATSNSIKAYSFFQLVNPPGFSNAQNTPLTADAVTLSNTTMITF